MRVFRFLAVVMVMGVVPASAQERYLGASKNPDGSVTLRIADGGNERVHIEPILPRDRDSIWKPVGVDRVRIAPDGTAVGWLVEFSECCAYGDALKLVVRSNGRTHVLDGPTVIWRWNFIENGTQVAFMARPLHGAFDDGYYLVDVATGTIIATYVHELFNRKRAQLPAWVNAVNAKH